MRLIFDVEVEANSIDEGAVALRLLAIPLKSIAEWDVTSLNTKLIRYRTMLETDTTNINSTTTEWNTLDEAYYEGE